MVSDLYLCTIYLLSTSIDFIYSISGASANKDTNAKVWHITHLAAVLKPRPGVRSLQLRPPQKMPPVRHLQLPGGGPGRGHGCRWTLATICLDIANKILILSSFHNFYVSSHFPTFYFQNCSTADCSTAALYCEHCPGQRVRRGAAPRAQVPHPQLRQPHLLWPLRLAAVRPHAPGAAVPRYHSPSHPAR